MSTAMSGRKIAERASADFDMGAFISIRRPISLSRVAVAARGEWERGRERGERGLFWVSGGPNLSFPAGRTRRGGQTFYPFALSRDPISRHLPLCAGVGSTVEAAKGRET